MREVIVWRNVENTLWQELDKECYESLRDKLFHELENKYDRLKNARHHEDETIFVVTLYQAWGGYWHRFDFHVDDTMTDSHLFVIDVIPHVDKNSMD